MNLNFLTSETQLSHGMSQDRKPLGDYDFEKDNLKGREETKATQSFTLTETSSATATTETGFNLGIMTGIEIEAKAGFFGMGVQSTYKVEMTSQFSFNEGYAQTNEKSLTYHYMVEVPVPPHCKAFINFFENKYTLETKWRANFRANGMATVKTMPQKKEEKLNLIHLLSYDERKVYSFGSMTVPRKKIFAISKIVDRDGNLVQKLDVDLEKKRKKQKKKKGKSKSSGRKG